MSTENPCCHRCDFTDGDTDITDPDLGCCAPIPVRIGCAAPILPRPACDEEEPTVEYDPETEEFLVLGILYDSECSPLSDSTASILTGAIA